MQRSNNEWGILTRPKEQILTLALQCVEDEQEKQLPLTTFVVSEQAYLKDAEGPQQIGELLSIELLLVCSMQDLVGEGW